MSLDDRTLEHMILNIEKEANALYMSLNSDLGRILDEIMYDSSTPSRPTENPRLVNTGNAKYGLPITYS